MANTPRTAGCLSSPECRRPGIVQKEHVFPGHQHVIEDDERVDFVESLAQWIVFHRSAASEPGAADVLDAGRVHLGDETEGKVRQRLVGHVVDSRAHVKQGFERGMRRHVVDALAVDPDLAAVANGVDVSLTRSNQLYSPLLAIAHDATCG